MDDCDLEKLTATPAKISPKFDRNVTEYSATVPSSVTNVKIDALTRDNGATLNIIGSEGKKCISLTEDAITEIVVEVTAEDGTTKSYTIKIMRLSASNASLSTLGVQGARLEPTFSSEEIQYFCEVPATVQEVTIAATAPDQQCEILVNDHALSESVPLNVGETKITVTAKSFDKKQSKIYTIDISRKQLLWPSFFIDSDLTRRLECPLTLAPMYCPMSIRNSEPKTCMSQACLDMFIRRSKINPFDETKLSPDWRNQEYDIDKEITSSFVRSAFEYKGINDQITLCKFADHVANTAQTFKANTTSAVTDSDWYKEKFMGSSAVASIVDHAIKARNWEKQLQDMARENDVEKLKRLGEESIKKYKTRLPSKIGHRLECSDDDSPNDHLHAAAVAYAGAIKGKFKDAALHLKLGLLLEEQYYLKELYGIQKKQQDQAAGVDTAAEESSMEEDCLAICKLHGVGHGASLASQLKVIDKEYHHLLDIGQTQKADYVMSLHAWKSRQAVKEKQTSSKIVDDSSLLGQAFIKFLDALVTDPNDYINNLHVGRMMLIHQRTHEAIDCLQNAVGLKPNSSVAKFYLGLALISQNGGPGKREGEALGFLHEGLEQMLQARLNEAVAKEDTHDWTLHSEDLWRINNTQILRGLCDFAQILGRNPQPQMRSAKEIYHSVCLQASTALTLLEGRNAIYKELEWIVLDCHWSLLEILTKEKSPPEDLMFKRCIYLLALIRNFTIPQSRKLLQLQEKVCQKLVVMQPCNSWALYLLGISQLSQYDNEPESDIAAHCLKDSRLSFHASISLEGKAIAGDPKEELINQKWWQDHKAAMKTISEKESMSVSGKATQSARGGRGNFVNSVKGTRGRGPTMAPRKATTLGAAAVREKGTAQSRSRGKLTSSTPTIESSKAKCDKPDAAKSVKQQQQKGSEEHETKVASPLPAKSTEINKKTHHARLGLARSLSRTDETLTEAKAMYEEVITMAPEIHEAYIELAEILIKTDPLAAVDVYCRFTCDKDDTSFDDAYISGEIVHILMKNEQFEDPRLQKHMIAYGRVMGIGVLENYMEILNAKFKIDLLKSVYAGVHRKSSDDPDLEAFFKFKCWM